MFVLSGCGVDLEGVDIVSTPPDGWWQTLVVWPLGRSLIWLDGLLANAGVPYHWGFAIILFTIAVKIVTFPLTVSQIRGMQAQKELQPRIQEIQKKYGKDREKVSQEQMKLYQEAGVNPLSGCLPLLVQMPILIGLYAALVAIGPNLRNANFFWIPDLGFPRYIDGLSWIPATFSDGDYGKLAAYLVLPILLMVSQFAMQKWMTPAPPPGGDDNPAMGMTRQLTYMMTFMFGFFTLQVPAGLTLYWVTSNLLQMLQQWVVTDARFGLIKPSKLTLATAGHSAALPEKSSAGDSDTGATAVPATAVTAPVTAEDAKSKAPRRRRAKRR
jgi:YidC/Oxa1 family membrane protein insertase